MPNSEMNNNNNCIDEYKKSNYHLTVNEKTTMLEVCQTIPKEKKKIFSNYKCIIITLVIIFIIFFIFVKNLSKIKHIIRERHLEINIKRNFSEIDNIITNTTSHEQKPLYWKNEKKLNIKKVKREINSYIKNSDISYKNKEDFVKRENPKVSLVIPVYNKESFLIPLYKSILNQSMKDIEIIFIDDNSSDNSVKLIESFMKEDKRIVLINHDINYRTFYSRNEGVRMAKGKYILFIDPDDLILNNILEKTYETAEANNLDIVQFYFLMGNFKISGLSSEFKYKSGILRQPQMKEIFYYSQTRNLWDKLIKSFLFEFENFSSSFYYNEILLCSIR